MSATALACALAVIGGVEGEIPDELLRMVGHDASIEGGALVVRDVAGDGRPRLGCIERRGEKTWLVETDRSVRLMGPLAIPRIAGPGYRVWVLGPESDSGIAVERIGVLSPPTPSRTCAPSAAGKEKADR